MMKMKKLLGVIFALTLFSAGTTVQAASISLGPATQTVDNGTQVSVEVYMDFTSEDTIGGGFDVFYNAAVLSFASWTFDANFFVALGGPADPAFNRDPDDYAGEINGIAFGNFFGMGGAHHVGTITFDAIGVGVSLLTLAVNDFPAGPFVSGVTFEEMLVDFSSTAEVIVTPLPAAAWLMLAGLGFLVSFGRRKMGVVSA